jgi:hypothetical protein
MNAGMPDDAIRVKRIGHWDVFFSKSESSVYFSSGPSAPALLRLTNDDLLRLVKGLAIWRSVKKAGAVVPKERNIRTEKISEEKRRLRRFTGQCKCAFASGGVSKKGIACDFSINGMFIRTNDSLASGSVIVIAAHLPDGSVSSLRGKVKRTIITSPGKQAGGPPKEHKIGMGIELLKKDANYLHFIRSMIK